MPSHLVRVASSEAISDVYETLVGGRMNASCTHTSAILLPDFSSSSVLFALSLFVLIMIISFDCRVYLEHQHWFLILTVWV